MADVVKFPGAPSDREVNDDGDRRHAEAFCNLEPRICDCTTMARIAAQMMFAKDDGTNRELVFVVAHVSEMLTALKDDYYAAYHGEKPREPA